MAEDWITPRSGSTDSSLLRLVKADDQKAWSQLVELYAPLVYHWFSRWSVAESDRADIFQEVFRAVSLHIEGFQRAGPEHSFRRWLRTIARSKVVDHHRRLRNGPVAGGGSDMQRWFDQVPAHDDRDNDSQHDSTEASSLARQALEMVRDSFEPKSWTAFWRTAIDGLNASEAAQELGMSPEAVRKAKSRVLRRIKDEFGDLLY